MTCLGGVMCKGLWMPFERKGRGWGNVDFGSGAFKELSGLMSDLYPLYLLSGSSYVEGDHLQYTKLNTTKWCGFKVSLTSDWVFGVRFILQALLERVQPLTGHFHCFPLVFFFIAVSSEGRAALPECVWILLHLSMGWSAAPILMLLQ